MLNFQVPTLLNFCSHTSLDLKSIYKLSTNGMVQPRVDKWQDEGRHFRNCYMTRFTRNVLSAVGVHRMYEAQLRLFEPFD